MGTPCTKLASLPESLTKRNIPLLIGGCFSVAFAVFQASAVFWPVDAIRYFGRPADASQTRPIFYALLCIVVAALVAACGIYALAGAGKVRRLPLLRSVITATTAVYLLRGLLLIPQMPIVIAHPEFVRFAVFSAISLCVGVIHMCGLIMPFRNGRPGEAALIS